jgi:hypothetical protein
VFTFAPQHRLLRDQLEQVRTWLDALATQLSGRKMTVTSIEGAASSSKIAAGPSASQAPVTNRQSDLRQQALAIQAFKRAHARFAEIKDVEEKNSLASIAAEAARRIT